MCARPLFPLRVPVTLVAHHEGYTAVESAVLALSACGIYLQSAVAVNLCEGVMLRFVVATSGAVCEAQGRISRATTGPRVVVPGFGVRFTRVNRALRQLTKLLSAMESAVHQEFLRDALCTRMDLSRKRDRKGHLS